MSSYPLYETTADGRSLKCMYSKFLCLMIYFEQSEQYETGNERLCIKDGMKEVGIWKDGFMKKRERDYEQ
jgi:hypothetical protein